MDSHLVLPSRSPLARYSPLARVVVISLLPVAGLLQRLAAHSGGTR